MKILQVITSLQLGGAETLVCNLVPRLWKMGHQVDVCVFNGKKTPLTEKLQREAPEAKIIALGKGYYNPLYIFRLAKIMRDYDIIHTHNSSPQLFVAIAKVLCSVELVSTEHTTSNRKRNWKWYRPIESWMYNQYDSIICISGIAEQKLREYMGRKWYDISSDRYSRITTINNGVDVQAIHNACPDEKLLKAKSNRNAILMVAGFREAKDQDTIVRALTHLNKDKYEVWFAGTGVRMDEVKQLANNLQLQDKVRFLGLRTDVPNVIKAADIIVMSSHWEGLSLSNIEGMSAGKPFIASDVNGLKEVTKGWGLLFEHGNDKELAALIEKLTENPQYYEKIANRCYERARQFDISQTVEQYDKVYSAL